jgi:hypothetical protein
MLFPVPNVRTSLFACTLCSLFNQNASVTPLRHFSDLHYLPSPRPRVILPYPRPATNKTFLFVRHNITNDTEPFTPSLVQRLALDPKVQRMRTIRDIELKMRSIRERVYDLSEQQRLTTDPDEYARLYKEISAAVDEEFRLHKEKTRAMGID